MKYWTIKSYDELMKKYSFKSAELFDEYKKGNKIALMSASLEELEELVQVIMLVKENVDEFFNGRKNTKTLDELLDFTKELIRC